MRAAICLLVLLTGGGVLAAEPGSGSWRYRIHHQIFGEIGEHRMSVAHAAGATVVEHAAELAVKLLGFTAFERRARFREVWRGGRLVEFDGMVEDDGERFAVTARAKGDRLIVEGSAGRIEAPAGTAPSEPSLEPALRHAWFFDSKTGALLGAKVAPAGREQLALGSGTVDTARYEITGDLEQQVWFDEAGIWVQWRLWRQGSAVTLTRE
jgi:hypothetical protein